MISPFVRELMAAKNYRITHHGFIQVVMGDGLFYNIYDIKIPRRQPIHTHDCCFHSTVLCGRLIQELYSDDYKLLCSMTLGEGASYYLQQDVFHRVRSKFAITRLVRCKERGTRPTRYRGQHHEYDASWAEVVRCLGGPKRLRIFSEKTPMLT
jgi:hypothetical protein